MQCVEISHGVSPCKAKITRTVVLLGPESHLPITHHTRSPVVFDPISIWRSMKGQCHRCQQIGGRLADGHAGPGHALSTYRLLQHRLSCGVLQLSAICPQRKEEHPLSNDSCNKRIGLQVRDCGRLQSYPKAWWRFTALLKRVICFRSGMQVRMDGGRFFRVDITAKGNERRRLQ